MKCRLAATFSGGGIDFPAFTIEQSDEELRQFECPVGAGAANEEFICAINRSLTKALYMVADQPVVIKTNSSSSPADTITLAANQPFLFMADAIPVTALTDHLTADVTAIFVTNGSETVATVLKICALVDAIN